MPRTTRQLAFLITAVFSAPFVFIAAAGAQIQAPVAAQAQALTPDGGAVPNAETAVGIALAFLSSYSPVADQGVRDNPSWKAKSVGRTWEVRESAPNAAGTFVVIIDKNNGSIVSVVQEQ
jgi:hypothetical protein